MAKVKRPPKKTLKGYRDKVWEKYSEDIMLATIFSIALLIAFILWWFDLD